MRTTIDIERGLLEEAMRLADVKTQKKAVALALAEFVHRRRLERLAARIGTFELSLTARDLRRMRRGA